MTPLKRRSTKQYLALARCFTARVGDSGRVAGARLAIGETVVAGGAPVAPRAAEARLALALPVADGIALGERALRVAIARKTRRRKRGADRSVVPVKARLAVDSSCVVLHSNVIQVEAPIGLNSRVPCS